MTLFGEKDGSTSRCSIIWPSFLMVCYHLSFFVIVVVRGSR